MVGLFSCLEICLIISLLIFLCVFVICFSDLKCYLLLMVGWSIYVCCAGLCVMYVWLLCDINVLLCFNGMFINFFSQFGKFLVLVLMCIIFSFFYDYVCFEDLFFFEICVIFMLSVIGFFFLIGSFDFLVLYVALELQTLALYILASYKSYSFYSTEAGLRYFVLGSFASGLFLFGVSLVYLMFGSINFGDLANILLFSSLGTGSLNFGSSTSFFFLWMEQFSYMDAGQFEFFFGTSVQFLLGCIDLIIVVDLFNYFTGFSFSLILLFCGFIFLLVGLVFKAGGAPFHHWLPDVYEGVPTIVTFFFAVVPKVSIVFLLLVLNCFFFCKFSFLLDLFRFFGYLSVFVGAVWGVFQYRLKRLISYSSILHTGFILFVLGCGNLVLSLFSAFFYIVVYIFMVAGFFCLILLCRKASTGVKLKKVFELFSLLEVNIVLGVSFIFLIFSFIGIPPLSGFFSKFMVLVALVWCGLVREGIFLLLLSVIGSFYYIRMIRYMSFYVLKSSSRPQLINFFILDSKVFLLFIVYWVLCFNFFFIFVWDLVGLLSVDSVLVFFYLLNYIL